MRSHTEQNRYYDGLLRGTIIENETRHTIETAVYHSMKNLAEVRANIIVPARFVLRNAYTRVFTEISNSIARDQSVMYTLTDIQTRVFELLSTEAEALQIHGDIQPIIEFITQQDLVLAIGVQLSPFFHKNFPHNYHPALEKSLVKTTALPPHSYIRFLQTRKVILGDTDEAKAA